MAQCILLQKEYQTNQKSARNCLKLLFVSLKHLRYPVVQYCLRLYTDPSKWILIDWDNAVGFPNSSSNHLTTKDHALEAFNKNHRWQVDI
ncbi:unnamed protein product [Rhizophagus irregularis]|nr:unnamed protein product [Rhizophagus irregularis]CAB5363813.1 unnamed protein product [Rhizophagus irregularis]